MTMGKRPVSTERQAGREAYFAGKPPDPPYQEDDRRHWDWLLGWAEAGSKKQVKSSVTGEVLGGCKPPPGAVRGNERE
jgi:ribosome modulation factor